MSLKPVTAGAAPPARRVPNSGNRSPAPVYLLAAVPLMIELAGEVADGAFLMVGFHAAHVNMTSRRVAARKCQMLIQYRTDGHGEVPLPIRLTQHLLPMVQSVSG
jgi:hypothetical protein